MSQSQARILVLPRPKLYRELFGPEEERLLRSLGEVVFHESESGPSAQELAANIGGFDIVLTGWGSPIFTDEVVKAATDLKLLAHTAGSIKDMFPPALFERGIKITHAAPAIAGAVAEWAFLLMLTMLQRPHLHDRNLRYGVWDKGAPPVRRELVGQRVGLVAASYTGRSLAVLLRGIGTEVWIYDPYLEEAEAVDLGVQKVGLDQLFSECRIVSLHAPITPETHKMIGARELALLADGALFVNTARAWLVDEPALIAELQSGRINAALDVFDNEPLPRENPFRELARENVLLTPHMAAHTVEARRRQGTHMVAEIQRYLAGESLLYEVKQEHLATMA
jgi:phosphoglycerate dehydrogenase-like enzyme